MAWNRKGYMVEDIRLGFLKAQACRAGLNAERVRALSQQRQAQCAAIEGFLFLNMAGMEDQFLNMHRCSSFPMAKSLDPLVYHARSCPELVQERGRGQRGQTPLAGVLLYHAHLLFVRDNMCVPNHPSISAWDGSAGHSSSVVFPLTSLRSHRWSMQVCFGRHLPKRHAPV